MKFQLFVTEKKTDLMSEYFVISLSFVRRIITICCSNDKRVGLVEVNLQSGNCMLTLKIAS